VQSKNPLFRGEEKILLYRDCLPLSSTGNLYEKLSVMKQILSLPALLLLSVLFLVNGNVHAQLWKRVKGEVQRRAENRAVSKAGDATDKAVDKAEEAVKQDKTSNAEGDAGTNVAAATPKKKSDAYKNYDFVPGDKIIFAPDLRDEKDAELPARFTIVAGSAEIVTKDGQKVLHMDKASHESIEPLMSTDHYLPEQYTLEFDMMYENDGERFAYVNGFDVEFRSRGDNNEGTRPVYRFHIESNTRGSWGAANSANQPFPESLATSMSTLNTWHHLAIYVRKNIGKVYIDGYRVAGSNTMPAGAAHVSLKGDPHYGFFIRDFRLAEGGEDSYNKIVTDGKFITHGILFEVNKAAIRPESMGVMNDLAKMMKQHPELRFEIDGHTDSDGNAQANMTLSLERAEAVKRQLVSMEVDASRLTTKGFGASKPIDSNTTSEGKANNRRVEFIKI
jgi:outer membrane protein OmpA-like peptidoglycan-associated protein